MGDGMSDDRRDNGGGGHDDNDEVDLDTPLPAGQPSPHGVSPTYSVPVLIAATGSTRHGPLRRSVIDLSGF